MASVTCWLTAEDRDKLRNPTPVRTLGSVIERIDPLSFLAGCRTTLLSQAPVSILSYRILLCFVMFTLIMLHYFYVCVPSHAVSDDVAPPCKVVVVRASV